MLIGGLPVDPSGAGSPDGTPVPGINTGRAGEMLVSSLHGTYFQECYRGNVFYASTTTGGSILQTAATAAPTYSLWNPAGSGKLMVPISLAVAWGTVTSVAGGVVWTATTNAGSAISSTAPFTSFTQTTILNANVGSGKQSRMLAATAASVIVAAATLYRATGITAGSTSLVAATAWWVAKENYDGTFIVPPGNAVHVMASTAMAATCCITTVWVEVPL